MAINFKKHLHLSASDRIALTFPGVKWGAESSIHKSISGYIDTANKTRATAVSKLIIHSLKLLRELPTIEWMVTPAEYVQLFLSTLPLPYEQPAKTKTHTERNPTTGNVYTPIAFRQDVAVLLRTWTEEDSGELYYRLRFVVASDTEIEGLAKDSMAAVDATTSHATDAAKEIAAAPVKVRETIFDFTPAPRVKALVRAKVFSGEDF